MSTPARVAVLSDIHGDLVAFEKVIADLERDGPVDEVLLGGDLAQGGRQPAEVVDLIQRRGWRSVRGNAEDLLVRIADGVTAKEAWAADGGGARPAARADGRPRALEH